MSEVFAALLLLIAVYGLVGLVVAVLLHTGPIERIDADVAGSGLGFRLLITPGLMALWPLMLQRWRAAARDGVPIRPYDRPLRSAHLRSLQLLAVQLLAIAAPLLVAAALASRHGQAPSELPDPLIPQAAPWPRAVDGLQPFQDLPIRVVIVAGGAGERMLGLDCRDRLTEPMLGLWLGASDWPGSAIYLGPVRTADGTNWFRVPAGQRGKVTLFLVRLTEPDAPLASGELDLAAAAPP